MGFVVGLSGFEAGEQYFPKSKNSERSALVSVFLPFDSGESLVTRERMSMSRLDIYS